MPSETDRPSLRQMDKAYLQQLRVGDRLFHYPPKGDAENSFRQSPSAEYTLYTVIDLPTKDDIVLLRAFDEEEEKKNFSRTELMAGDWWYIPDEK